MLLLAMLVLAIVLVVGSLLLLLLLLMPTLFHRRPTHNSDSRLKEEKHTVISSCRVSSAPQAVCMKAIYQRPLGIQKKQV